MKKNSKENKMVFLRKKINESIRANKNEKQALVVAKKLGLYDPDANKKIAKVKITTYIDNDILDFLKKKSKKSRLPLETILNKILRVELNSAGQKEWLNELEKVNKIAKKLRQKECEHKWITAHERWMCKKCNLID